MLGILNLKTCFLERILGMRNKIQVNKLCFKKFFGVPWILIFRCLFVSFLSLTCHLEFTMQSLKQIFCGCSVTKSCLTLCDPMDCSTLDFPVLHCLLELAQTHVHWVDDAIQTSYPLLTPSPALSLSQHQSLSQWVGSLHQVARVSELQLQHQSFQCIFRVDFL